MFLKVLLAKCVWPIDMKCEVCGKILMSKWVFELRDGTEVCVSCFKKGIHDLKGLVINYPLEEK